jgi:hypothetical protein
MSRVPHFDARIAACGELSRCEVRRAATQLLEDRRCIAVNRMLDHCTGACTGRREVLDSKAFGMGGC